MRDKYEIEDYILSDEIQRLDRMRPPYSIYLGIKDCNIMLKGVFFYPHWYDGRMHDIGTRWAIFINGYPESDIVSELFRQGKQIPEIIRVCPEFKRWEKYIELEETTFLKPIIKLKSNVKISATVKLHYFCGNKYSGNEILGTI